MLVMVPVQRPRLLLFDWQKQEVTYPGLCRSREQTGAHLCHILGYPLGNLSSAERHTEDPRGRQDPVSQRRWETKCLKTLKHDVSFTNLCFQSNCSLSCIQVSFHYFFLKSLNTQRSTVWECHKNRHAKTQYTLYIIYLLDVASCLFFMI